MARSVALRAGSPRIVPRQTTGGPPPDAALAQETNDERLTTKAPYKALGPALDAITAQDTSGLFRHAGYSRPK